MANETFTVTQTTTPNTDVRPNDVVNTTVTIENNSTNTNATNVQFAETLNGMTLVDGTLNVSPIAFNDSGVYTTAGNVEFTASVSVLDNDTEPLGPEGLDLNAGTAIQGAGIQGPTSQGGTVTINADGTFDYTSAAGFEGADTFTYTLVDAGGLTSTATVSVTVGPSVWFIDGSAPAGGNGTQASPFNSIAAFNAAQGTANGPDAGDFIYVRQGTYSETDGINLADGQTLIGAGQDLVVNGVTIETATTAPTIVVTGAGNQAIQLAENNSVRGLDIGMTNATAVGIEDDGGTVGNLTISDVSFSGISNIGRAIDIDAGGALTVTIDEVRSTNATGMAIDLQGVSGTFNVGDGVITGGSGAAFNVSGGSVSSTFSANIFQANNAALVNVAGGHNGTLTFTDSLTGTNGTGLQFDNADGTYNFNGTNTLSNTVGGANAGVDIINGSAGNFSFSSNSSITNPTGVAFNVSGGTGNIDYNGTISQNQNARAINVDNHTGGTVSFDGTVSSTGTSDGINLDNNDNAIINFTNTLTINTSGTTGFNAVNGGTVTATGSGSTINSGNGIALNVVGTNIGVADLNFQSISANGASNGIVLNNTGTTASFGGLTVTGDATASDNGSGGTIQNTTGVGILLTNTRDVSLEQMNINNSGDDGIRGQGVTNFALNLANLTNNGNAVTENGIQFGEATGSVAGVFGTVSITNTDVSGSAANHVHIRNTSGTLDSFIVTNSTFNNLDDAPTGTNAFLFEASGTATVTEAFITGSTFANNSPQRALEVQAHDTATVSDFVVSGNTFNANGIHASFTQDTSSNLEFYLVDNNITQPNTADNVLQAVNVFSSSQSTGGTIVGTISGNTINTNAENISGIEVVIQGRTDATLLIDDNDVTNTSGSRGISVAFRGPTSAVGPVITNDVTITNNDVDNVTGHSGTLGVDFFPLAAISVEADNQSGNDAFAPIVRADIAGNTVPSGGAFDLTSAYLQFYEYDAVNAHGIGQLVDRPPASADADAQLAGANTGSTDAFGIALIAGPINVPPPVPTPLLAAAGGVEVGGGGSSSKWSEPGADVPPPDSSGTESSGTDTAPPVAPPQTTPPQDTGGESAGDTSGGTPQTSPQPNTPAAPTTPIVDDGVLSQAELDYLVDAAITRWADSGLSAEQVAALENVTFSVSDMSGLYLGSFAPGHITLDSDGAGHGWFLDATPLDDSEFGNGSGTRLTTDPTGAPAGHYDVLTTVMHEMGHTLGLEDSYASGDRDDLMYGYLFVGERRLPGDGDADGAVAGAITSEEFLGAPIDLGTLPFGQSVTIQWQATIDTQPAGFVSDLSNQGLVTADDPFPDTLTDDPNVGGTADPTITTVDGLTLGDRVFLDNNTNGVFDAGDTGIANVTLRLYVDNGNNVFDDGIDTFVGTDDTDPNGFYSFEGLAEGSYIVQIEEAEFGAGGALDGLISIAGNPDPDNNLDNDDNGERVLAAGVVSQAITLSYDDEPDGNPGGPSDTDADADADTNTTLDFGFLANTPPTVNPTTGSGTEDQLARVEIQLSGTDSDAGDAIVHFVIDTVPANGQLFDAASGGNLLGAGSTVAATGNSATVYFVPNADFNGASSFTYSGFDGDQAGAPATASITIASEDDTNDDNLTTNEDDDVTANVLTGTNGASADAFEGSPVLTNATNGTNGTVTFNANGEVTYTPAPNFFGNDSFTYEVTSGGVTETGTVNVTINSVDDEPDAVDDSATVAEDALLVRDAATGLLANDADPDGPAFTAVAGTFTTTEGGVITIAADGSYTYMAAENFSGTDTVDYTIDNGTQTDTATLTVTVNAVADGPNVHAGASGLHRTVGTFDINGQLLDPRIDVSNADEDRPRTAAGPDGSFVMVWTQSTGTPNILAQRFQANGDAAGNIITVSPAAGPGESQPDVITTPNGGFAVVWVQSDGVSSDLNVAIYGDPLSPIPTGNVTLSNVGGVAEINPTITFLGGVGNQFLVTWEVAGGLDTDIYGQRFQENGTLVDVAPVLLAGTADNFDANLNPTPHSVAALGNNNFALTWVEGGNVNVQVFDNTLTGGAIEILNEGTLIDRSHSVALLADDRFVVVWESTDAGTSNLWAQFFNPDGTTDGAAVELTASIPSSEFEPSVSGLPDGGFALSWLGNDGPNNTGDVRVQTFNADGTPRSSVLQVTSTGFTPNPGAAAIAENDQTVTVLEDGRILLSWVDPDPDTVDPRASQDDILYQIYDPGSGGPLVVDDTALTITVPTQFFLFDGDGSETLDLILVQGLSDFGHSLQVGYQDVGFVYDPGPYLDAAWVIERGHSAEEDALLDALIADPDNTNIIINLSGANPGDFNFAINGMTTEASNASTRTSVSRTIDVQFEPIDFEPTLTATGQNPTFAEDGAAVDLYGAVVASTEDAGQTFVSMTLAVSNVTDGADEILFFDGSDVALTHGNSVTTATNGLTVTVSLTGTTATVSFSGAALSEAALETLVDTLAYRNTSQNPTDADRVVTITELVDSGDNTPPEDNTATLNLSSTVNVNPSNDAAIITGDTSGDVQEAGGTNNGTPGDQTDSSDLDYTDADNDPDDVWQAAAAGSATSNGFGTYELTDAGVWTYTLDDTDPQVQALNGANTLTDSFTALTSDGTAQVVTITISAQNDAPVAQDGTDSGDEDTVISGTAVANDVDNTAVQLTYTLVGPDGGAQNGSVTMNSDGTFDYTGDPDFFGTDTFTFVATDPGLLVSNQATITVTVDPVNDAPDGNAVNGADINYNENQAPTQFDPGLTVTDPDDTDLEAARVTLTGFVAGQDVLAADTSGTTIVANFNAGTGVLDLTGTATLADYQQVLRTVTYFNSSDDPSNAARTAEFEVDDGDTVANIGDIGVTVVPINDNPALNNVPASTAYRRGDPAVVLAGAATVLDLDTPTFDTATVTITDMEAGDLLAADTTGTAITATYDSGTGVLTLAGPDTLANYQQVLRSVTFETPGGDGSRHLTWQLDDGEAANNLSTVVNSVITMATALNDFGGDGQSDIFWRSDDGQLLLWEMDGPNIAGSNLVDITMREYWHVLDIADVTGDGRNDILWQDDAGVVVLWEMDGATIVDHHVLAGSAALGAMADYWHFEGAGDFTGDGRSDLLWRDDAGAIVVWEVDGATVTGQAAGNLGLDWTAAEIADFNGDGNADILWRHENGTVRLWEMDGASVIGDTNIAVMPAHWDIAASGDYNGDGNADILWLDTAGEILMWQMDGPTIIGSTTIGTVPTTQHVIDSGDYNGDGNADILWQDNAGTVSLWEMDGANVLAMTNVATMPAWWQIQP